MASEQNPLPESKAPAIPRENMINTAVSFLQNPRVKTSSLSQKKAFLYTKGLTDEEVNIAIQRTGISNSEVMLHQMQPLVPANNAGPTKTYHPSVWTQLYRTSSAFVVMGVAVYGLHQFYKLYVEPWIYGCERKDHLTLLKDQLLEVQLSLAELQKSVSSMEKNINGQKSELNVNDIDPDQLFSPLAFMEMRSDIATIKSLLLNRNQFPEVPKIFASIPSWQLPVKEKEKSEDVATRIENKSTQNNPEGAKRGKKKQSRNVVKTVNGFKNVGNDGSSNIINDEVIVTSDLHSEKPDKESSESKEVSPEGELTPDGHSEVASTGSDFSIISGDVKLS